MTPKELRRDMRKRAKAMRKELAQAQVVMRQRVAQNPHVQRAQRRRRIIRIAILICILLLLLFIRCDCGPPQPIETVIPDAGVIAVKPKPIAPPKKPPFSATITPQPRGKFANAEPGSPPWLDEFRLQVSARSPRLAACFSGNERPGALRWTSSVNATSGAVSEHEVEPIAGSGLDGTQRDCLIRALSSPTYKLTDPAKTDLPSRVSIVIEF